MKKTFIIIAALLVGSGLFVAPGKAQVNDPDPPVISCLSSNLLMEAEAVTHEVHACTNENSNVTVRYGTASGNYTTSLNAESSYEGRRHNAVLLGLGFETTYYYQVIAKDLAQNETRSAEQTFTTGKRGVHIESLTVKNITDKSADVVVKTNKRTFAEVRYGSVAGTLPNVVGENEGIGGSTDNTVKLTDLRPNTTYYYRLTASVPNWDWDRYRLLADRATTTEERSFTTAKEGTTPTNAANANVSAPNYVTKAYGCSYSTSAANETTVRVQSQFAKGSETDVYLGKVSSAYQSEWKRAPRCTELQFHLDHATPLERLTAWLKEQKVTEQFGCKISTEAANEETIRVAKPLTHNNADDQYLEKVYAAYQAQWGRYPRCTELQFHLDHATPLERLTAWLKENVPAADAKPTEALVTKKLEFTQSGTALTVQTSNKTFQESDIITFSGTATPNSIVSLAIASSEPTYVTVLSDSDGTWSYTLPGPLAPGDHTVSVTVSDKDGTKLGESGAVAFMITATAAATATNAAVANANAPTTATGLSMSAWILIVIAAVVVIIVAILIVARKK